MGSVEVALQGIDMHGPHLAKLCEPSVYFAERFGPQAVYASLCIYFRLHEPGIAQHFEVLGDRGLRNMEQAFDLANGSIGSGQETEDRAAIGLADDFES